MKINKILLGLTCVSVHAVNFEHELGKLLQTDICSCSSDELRRNLVIIANLTNQAEDQSNRDLLLDIESEIRQKLDWRLALQLQGGSEDDEMDSLTRQAIQELRNEDEVEDRPTAPLRDMYFITEEYDAALARRAQEAWGADLVEQRDRDQRGSEASTRQVAEDVLWQEEDANEMLTRQAIQEILGGYGAEARRLQEEEWAAAQDRQGFEGRELSEVGRVRVTRLND